MALGSVTASHSCAVEENESSWLSDSDSEKAAYEKLCEDRIPVHEVLNMSDDATFLFFDPMDSWEEEANAHFAVPVPPVTAVEHYRRFLGVAEGSEEAQRVAGRFNALSPEDRMPFLLLDQRDLERYRRELDAREPYYMTGTRLVRRYHDGQRIWWRCTGCLAFNGHFP